MSSRKRQAFPGTLHAHGDGMNLLDYFAGQALVAIIQKMDFEEGDAEEKLKIAAVGAYDFAESMIEVRNLMDWG